MSKAGFYLTICLLLSYSLFITAQNKHKRGLKNQLNVSTLLISKDYTINVQTAYPQRGNMVSLSSDYSLKVKNDSVFSFLPYYGRAYNIPYGGGDGLVFNSTIKSYKLERTKKENEFSVTFSATTTEDKYRFSIQVYSDGSSYINIMMNQRESISFSGQLELP